MKRIKKITLILFFIVLFVPFAIVKADTTCADVKETVNYFENVESKYKSKKCESASISKTVAECNELSVTKASLLSQIFEYYDEKACPSVDLATIVAENKNECSNELSSDIKTLADNVMNTFYVIAPFILILFGSLDFFKSVAGNNPEEIKKNRNNFFKRLAAFVLLYITPFFVKTLFSLTPYGLDKAHYICYQVISLGPKETAPAVTGTYDPSTGGSGGNKIAEAAKKNAEFAKKNGFTYADSWKDNPPLNCRLNTCYTSKNSYKTACCATLVSVSIYDAGILKADEIGGSMHSAPGMAQVLSSSSKFKFLKTDKEKDLKPGDILIYKCLSGCNTAKINGVVYHIGHVAVYAGNGKQYDHGWPDWIKAGSINFRDKASNKVLLGVFRYTGN